MKQGNKDPLEAHERRFVEQVRRSTDLAPRSRDFLELFDKYLPKPDPWWEALAKEMENPATNGGYYNCTYVADEIRRAAREAGE